MSAMVRAALAALLVILWLPACGPQQAPGSTDAGPCGAAGQACCPQQACNGGLSCLSNVCESPQQMQTDLGAVCTKNLDCTSGICLPVSPTQDVCTVSCSGDGGCLAGWTCGALPGQPGEICQCTPSPEVCDGKDNDCNGVIDDEPAANAWCVSQDGPGATCSAGTCVTGSSCTSSADCLAGQICNPQTHVCSDDTNGVDAGPSVDAGRSVDAGAPDGGAGFDGGLPQDGGNVGPGPDAGPEDAGPSRDAGTSHQDAGASGQDAGMKSDGGIVSCVSRPTAVINLSQANASVDPATQFLTPLSTITLNGSSSVAPVGAITSYRWQLAAQPTGGISEITGSGSSVTLLPKFVGQYVVTLVVQDDSGCVGGVEVTFNVGLATGIVVQLSWPQTYGDLDLHYVGPGGTFNEETPYYGDLDYAFAQNDGYGLQTETSGILNESPDWGLLDGGVRTIEPDGISTDDGTFLMDQRLGYGGEIVLYPAPFDATFTIMVHYFCSYDDQSLGSGTNNGPTTPIITVWFKGQQVWSGQSEPMQQGQIWTAATVKITNAGADAIVMPQSVAFTTAPTAATCAAATPVTVPVCTTNTECATDPAGPVCDTTYGTCTQCLSDSDCATGDVCQFNQCAVGPSDGGVVVSPDAGIVDLDGGLPGDECNTDADCPAGETCFMLEPGLGLCL